MNYIFLSPHFPPNYYHFCVGLKKFGANVLGLGDQDYDSLRPELKYALTEYYRVDDLHNYDQLLRALGYFTHKYGKIHGIDSNNEYWLETEARLRTDFNIDGIKVHQLADIKNKSAMKKVFEAAGVPVAQGRVINTREEAKVFISEVDYPIVAKPDTGVGAANTYKITNEEELEFFFETKPDIPYIFEEFIDGIIESFDGLTDACGNPIFFTAHSFDKGVMVAVNEDQHISYYSFRDVPKDLEEAGRKILKAFKVQSRFFHFEFFRLHKNNKLVALEVNMRPPGGFTTDMFNYACDFDIYHEWASMIANNKITAPFSRKFHVFFVGRKNNKNYKISHQEVLERHYLLMAYHSSVPDALSMALGNYTYILRHKDLSILAAARDEIQALD